MFVTGKAVIITGASQGIGKALAERFAAEGASVAILDRQTEKARRVCSEINERGGRAIPVETDVSDPGAVTRSISEVIGHYGRIDVLVNNAGVYLMTPVGTTCPSDVEAMLNVNVKGLYYVSEAVLPAMASQGGGKVINIGSIYGQSGFPTSAIYCATKAAVHSLTKTMAIELRERNVQVNCLAPGLIETELNEEFRKSNQEYIRRCRERFGGENGWLKPDELTGAALFLASGASDSVTGTIMYVDRGWAAY